MCTLTYLLSYYYYYLGDLFYDQVEQNYKKTIEVAEIVQWGPAYCPKGSKITASGLGNCTDINSLVKKCKQEIIGGIVSKLTMGLAKAITGGERRRLAIAAWQKVRRKDMPCERVYSTFYDVY